VTGQPPQPETILVVEDQDVVRHLIVRALLQEGYHVLEASDGAKALAVLAGGVRVHMVVTDIVMPNLGGVQLAERLTLQGRAPVLLFMTGYGEDRSKVPGPLLEKPFGPETLVSEVARLLSRARP